MNMPNLSQQNQEDIEKQKTLEIISELAQQRRQEAKPALERKLPSWLISIPQTEVAYTIIPRQLPLDQISFPVFKNLLFERYNITFKRPELNFIYQQLAPERQLSDDEIGSIMLRQDSPELEFVNGRFPISKTDFVPIKRISIVSERIHVIVKGISQVAELVTKEVAELLWASIGINKRWDDIKNDLQVIHYGSATVVNLGFSLEEFLNPKLRDFIETNMLSGKFYASYMGGTYSLHNFSAPPKIRSIFNIEGLDLLFHRFDQVTGITDETGLQIRIPQKNYRGTGIIYIASELPFDTHVLCIEDMIKSLSPE